MMFFNNEKSRKQLIDEGIVITYRRSRRRIEGNDIAVYTIHELGRKWIIKIGKINIEYLCACTENVPRCLSMHLENSGFESIEEWIKEIKSHDAYRRIPEYGYLYKVRIREMD